MLEENRGPTLEALRKSGADVGIAWDGDYDRCFFYDSKGAFIEGYYIVGLAGRELSSPNNPARASSTTRASPGTPSTR